MICSFPMFRVGRLFSCCAYSSINSSNASDVGSCSITSSFESSAAYASAAVAGAVAGAGAVAVAVTVEVAVEVAVAVAVLCPGYDVKLHPPAAL